jgi:hypothetical protein
MALGSELSLDNLLQRLTSVAAELTDARYAALGVIEPTGSHLERFITHGSTKRPAPRSATRPTAAGSSAR